MPAKKPVPRRGPKGKTYLRPRYVHWKTVAERGDRRGEILRRHIPALKPVEELGIRFHPDGSVRTPYYRQLPTGEIELAGYARTKTPYDTIRKTAITIREVEYELPRMQIAQQNLAALHTTLCDKWKEMNPNQRERMKAYIYGLIDYIQRRREGYEKLGFYEREKIKRHAIVSPDKKNAVERIEKAIELMERGNIGAARTALVGASNDLISRMNTLIKESAFLRRRRKSILQERVLNEMQVFSIFNALGEVREKIIAAPEMPPDVLIRSLRNTLLGIDELTYERFSIAKNHIERSIELLQTRAKTGDIRRALTNAMNAVYLTASECTIFSMERLSKLKGIGGPKTKMEVIRNQAKLFADNAKYWYEIARPEQKEHMYAFIKMLRSVLTGTPAQPAVVTISQAERALRDGKTEECKKVLLEASEFIGEKLKKKRK